jgi:hypothetical protein
MKKKIKMVVIIVILLLVGVLAAVGVRTAKTYLSGASGGKEPQNVRVQADVKSATVTWQTDKEVQGTVEYGTTPASLLLRALENQPSTTHRVVLSPLKEETTYYFRIRVGEEIYDNNGIPYSFKTKPGEVTVSPTVAVQPTVAATPTTRPTVNPTEAPEASPTSTSSGTKVTTCNKSDFMEKFGTSDSKYDFDENGTVNTSDWVQCLNQNN